MPVALLISDSGALGAAQRALLASASHLDGERILAAPDGPLTAAARAAGVRVLSQASSAGARWTLHLRRLAADLAPERVLLSSDCSLLTRLALGRAGRDSHPHSGPSLAIVTVTRNSAPELGAMLGSVRRHLPRAEVVVVDSDSNDDSVAVARQAGATVLELDRNLGFGAANNRGLEEVRAPVTALLNPDVELLDDSLLELAAHALASGRLLAPLVLSPDGSRQDTVHPLPGSPAELLGAVLPHLGARIAPWRARSARPVGWAVACAIVGPTQTLAGLGPFNERIFLYYEDLDLCLRARRQGVPTWFWPTGRVLHHRAHSSQREFGGEPFELLAQARRDAIAGELGSRAARMDDLSQAVTFLTRLGAKRLLGREAGRERRQLSALRSTR